MQLQKSRERKEKERKGTRKKKGNKRTRNKKRMKNTQDEKRKERKQHRAKGIYKSEPPRHTPNVGRIFYSKQNDMQLNDMASASCACKDGKHAYAIFWQPLCACFKQPFKRVFFHALANNHQDKEKRAERTKRGKKRR